MIIRITGSCLLNYCKIASRIKEKYETYKKKINKSKMRKVTMYQVTFFVYEVESSKSFC